MAARSQTLVLALEHHVAGRFDDAAALYQELHAASPEDSELLFLMGVLCSDLGLYEAACRFLEQALERTPEFPEARAQWAVALRGRALADLTAGKLAPACALLERAVAAAPDDAQTLSWLGLAQLQMERYPAAESSLRRALLLDPTLKQAWNNRGLALHHQGDFGAALDCFAAAEARDPSCCKARINRAITLRLCGEHGAARRELERVLETHPEQADALNNLGAVCQDLGLTALAHRHLSRAHELAPQSAPIRWNLALTQLLLGDFAAGWANFETRFEGCAHLRGGDVFPAERAWHGESLRGKRLLLWAEQGFGDTLQFIRFAADAAERGANVNVLCPPELALLLDSAPGVGGVFTERSALPPYDCHCPLMSLPHRLGMGSDPARWRGADAYLTAAPERVLDWRRRLGSAGGLKVGLVWAGSARTQSRELTAIDARRSIAPQRLLPLLGVAGCRFFSLQKGATTADRPAGLEDFSAEWPDFAATAAFVATLDLIISVDTAVAHLAGALGRPVWLLNRYDSCWRWLEGRDDSPWYGSLRQFRQPAAGDWEPVIAAAAVALAEAVAAGTAGAAVTAMRASAPVTRVAAVPAADRST